MDHFDDLLGGGEAGAQLGAGDPGPDALAEVLHDLVVDVGFEQGQPDFAEGGVDVLGLDDAATAELLEGSG